ncbi:hypothetical protein ERO13_A13G073200v2 [Gossypium hirsutum]|uniref:Uncharacterized protein n=4 Tax=Gossypium TaxID=3633 RepID=A0A5J5T211_GOSBA|nr:hypothetical protein ES319_A13G078900v1 [Gossypium barbadense]KAG4165351.1 hypothetical protein ERO13_A13G073200v2 [Gossypium hirsutum]TYG85781.1 hypothetical protein ES288_A13G082500v1 [Gossypium darwinii]TYH90968.1 hypothetical protein ES332_A13G085400v1 [Gossypium tomentosum]TYJ00359.1 hypothetical protein E1A91_A13G081600v1 [Gossypium mustelinum]
MKHQEKPLSFGTHHKWHSPSLQLLTDSPPDSLLYSYTEAFNPSLLANRNRFWVYEYTICTLHPTRSPQFLGLEYKSFDDAGMPEIPS